MDNHWVINFGTFLATELSNEEILYKSDAPQMFMVPELPDNCIKKKCTSYHIWKKSQCLLQPKSFHILLSNYDDTLDIKINDIHVYHSYITKKCTICHSILIQYIVLVWIIIQLLAYGKNELNIDLSKSTFTNKQGINYQLVTKLV